MCFYSNSTFCTELELMQYIMNEGGPRINHHFANNQSRSITFYEVFEHLGFSRAVFAKKHPEDKNRNTLVGNHNMRDQTRDYDIISLQGKHGVK